MSRAPGHVPVLVEEVVALFARVPAGVLVDATVGAGGHAAAILAACPQLAVLGIDRDPEALALAAARLEGFGDRVVLLHARFGDLGSVVADARAAGRGRWPTTGEVSTVVSGVLFDLGVSSMQLEAPDRGFSYRHEAPLDMRMDRTRAGRDAMAVLNEASEGELARWFAASGEQRFARRIARSIVAARPLVTTTQLAELVEGSIPAAQRRRGHPASRVFQAVRIAVNDELEELSGALPAALDLLGEGGRCVVIAYHSGEDRLVKSAFALAATGGCQCPPGLPCVCGARSVHRLLFRGAKKPSAAEIARNPRASSARLRAIERVVSSRGPD